MSQQILFVDDEPFFARHYVERLKEAKYEVILKDSADGVLS